MISYAGRRVFTGKAMAAAKAAALVVSHIKEVEDEKLRCHEVARIVQRILKPIFPIKLRDGSYGICIDHSWCLIDGYILDVYAVGSIPQVQLVDANLPGINAFNPAQEEREGVNHDLVDEICAELKMNKRLMADLEDFR